MQSSSQIITTNKPTSIFYRPDALPVSQPTVSKHWRENITFHGLAYLKLIWGLSTLSLTTNSSCLLWERVVMPLISPLMPVPQFINLFCSVNYHVRNKYVPQMMLFLSLSFCKVLLYPYLQHFSVWMRSVWWKVLFEYLLLSCDC